MADSTTHLDLITANQSGKEVTANALFDAASSATTYGRRASTCSGLTWGYYGGQIVQANGTVTSVANGTLSLTASSTNYIVASKASGAVSASTATTNWNDDGGYWRLYSIVTGTETVTSYADKRCLARFVGADAIEAKDWELSIASQTDSYTLVLSDANRYVRVSKATACNVTVPPNSSVAYNTGTQIHIRQAGAGQVTLVAGSGVTLNTSETLKLRKLHATATIIKIATDTWDVVGDMELAP